MIKFKFIITFAHILVVLLYFPCEIVASCSRGQFSFNGGKCWSWLKCSEMQDLPVGDLIGFGAVKHVYKSSWKNYSVAVVMNNNPKYLTDFHHGLDLLIRFEPGKYTPLLIGYCKESNVYVTKLYPLGSLLHFLNSDLIQNLEQRFKLCLNYIEIVNYLHTEFDTPYVMCDTNTLNKTLEQYLMKDIDRIILNDIDALARVEGGGIICGSKEITGKFVAPEQLWPYREKPYDNNMMIKYNEKTDIWKIPSVCNRLIGNSQDGITAKYHLFKFNKRCLSSNSIMRPNASEVFEFYKNVYNYIFLKKEEL